jgi:hypothetical protein
MRASRDSVLSIVPEMLCVHGMILGEKGEPTHHVKHRPDISTVDAPTRRVRTKSLIVYLFPPLGPLLRLWPLPFLNSFRLSTYGFYN